MTEQGYPPRQPGHNSHFGNAGYPGRAGRPRTAQESRNDGWQALDAFEPGSDPDSDVPPWAIPGGIEPMRPARRATRTMQAEPEIAAEEPRPVRSTRAAGSGSGRRPGRSRAAATRRRRSRRRLTTWGSVLTVAAVIAVAVYYLTQPNAPTRSYITTLQKGEFRAVPNACRVLGPSSLVTYLSGKPTKHYPTVATAAKSVCTFELDAKPTFRELDITMEAYTPSLIAPGNGSATSYATYTFAQTRHVLASPPKHTPEPPATITPLSGLGSQALSAVQYFRQGSRTDRVIVLVRVRNVLITISLWASVGSGFGPVSIPQMQGYAQAAARTTASAVAGQPAVA